MPEEKEDDAPRLIKTCHGREFAIFDYLGRRITVDGPDCLVFAETLRDLAERHLSDAVFLEEMRQNGEGGYLDPDRLRDDRDERRRINDMFLKGCGDD